MSDMPTFLDDNERHRMEHVRRVEHLLTNTQREVEKYRPLAEKWEPVMESVTTPSAALFTLAFGGKRITVSVDQAVMTSHSAGDVTTHVIDTLLKELVGDVLRPIVLGEVERQHANAEITAKAGKW
jgi:hypothetical protein